MRRGALRLASVGAMTFAPDGTLFVADNIGARVFAIDLATESISTAPPTVAVQGVNRHIASYLGTAPGMVFIHDMTVHPATGEIYLSVSRGGAMDADESVKGTPDATRSPHLMKIDAAGTLSEVDLDDVRFAEATLQDVRAAGESNGRDRRTSNILDIQYDDGTLWVSGMSSDEWSSRIRRLNYPFDGTVRTHGMRIFHTAHGRYETTAPARVFVPFERDGQARIFAGYSCTPLVEFTVADMDAGDRVEGKTIAELGAGNHVLDMIAVERAGKTYFLLANHLHPFTVFDVDDFEGAQSLVRPTNRAGVERMQIRGARTLRLANHGADRVLMLREGDGEALDLVSVAVDELID